MFYFMTAVDAYEYVVKCSSAFVLATTRTETATLDHKRNSNRLYAVDHPTCLKSLLRTTVILPTPPFVFLSISPILHTQSCNHSSIESHLLDRLNNYDAIGA